MCDCRCHDEYPHSLTHCVDCALPPDLGVAVEDEVGTDEAISG
jgi:hypothetical protein